MSNTSPSAMAVRQGFLEIRSGICYSSAVSGEETGRVKFIQNEYGYWGPNTHRIGGDTSFQRRSYYKVGKYLEIYL